MAVSPRRHRPFAVGAALAASALLLAACGGGSGTGTGAGTGTTPTGQATTPGGATPADTLAALVPSSIKSDGKIVVGTDASYAPNEFVGADGKTIEGMDVDLGNAIAKKLGLTAEWVNSPFDAIIPGLQSGKFELGMSSFTDNKQREQVVDFVTYYSAGTSWAVKKGNPANITPDTACGKKVAVQKGTVQVDDMTARSKKCTDAKQPAITIDQYQLQSDATAAVVSGKDDAMLADSPVVGYAVKQTNGQLELAGQSYDTAPYGIAIPKNAGQMKEAVQGALKALIADGTYQQILTKWGVESGAIKDPVINGATS